jgi:hypothetical protein
MVMLLQLRPMGASIVRAVGIGTRGVRRYLREGSPTSCDRASADEEITYRRKASATLMWLLRFVTGPAATARQLL